MMDTLTVRCRWGGEKAKEKAGHLASYAEAKKMSKLLSLRNRDCMYLYI